MGVLNLPQVHLSEGGAGGAGSAANALMQLLGMAVKQKIETAQTEREASELDKLRARGISPTVSKEVPDVNAPQNLPNLLDMQPTDTSTQSVQPDLLADILNKTPQQSVQTMKTEQVANPALPPPSPRIPGYAKEWIEQTLKPKTYQHAAAGSVAFDPNEPSKQIPIGEKATSAKYTNIISPDESSSTGFRHVAWDKESGTTKPGPEAPQSYANKPQQTSFVDENNNPYTFDPTNGEYVPATVRGKGKIMPRKKSLTDQTTNDMASGVTYLNQIDKIEKMYNDALAGPAMGNINKAAGMVMNNPEFQGLKLNIGTLRTVVYQLSGKQINETEQKWLDQDILPKLTQPNENFKAKLGELKAWMKDKLVNQVSTYRTSYIIPSYIEDYLKSSTPAQGNQGNSMINDLNKKYPGLNLR